MDHGVEGMVCEMEESSCVARFPGLAWGGDIESRVVLVALLTDYDESVESGRDASRRSKEHEVMLLREGCYKWKCHVSSEAPNAEYHPIHIIPPILHISMLSFNVTSISHQHLVPSHPNILDPVCLDFLVLSTSAGVL